MKITDTIGQNVKIYVNIGWYLIISYIIIQYLTLLDETLSTYIKQYPDKIIYHGRIVYFKTWNIHLKNTEQYWAIPDNIGQYWTIFGNFIWYWKISRSFVQYLNVSSNITSHIAIKSRSSCVITYSFDFDELERP